MTQLPDGFDDLVTLLSISSAEETDQRWPDVVERVYALAHTSRWHYVALLCLAHLVDLGRVDPGDPAYAEHLAYGHRINDALFIELCRKTSTPLPRLRQLKLPGMRSRLPIGRLRWVDIVDVRALILYIVAYSKVFDVRYREEWVAKAVRRDVGRLDALMARGALMTMVRHGAALNGLEWKHFTKRSMYEAVHLRLHYASGFMTATVRVGGLTARSIIHMSEILHGVSGGLLDLADNHFAVRLLGLEVFDLLRRMQTPQDDASGVRDALRAFYDFLLAPSFEKPGIAQKIASLGPYPTLVVTTHGALAQVPFAALHDGERHLVERFNVVQAPPLFSTKDFGLGGLDWNAMHGGEPIPSDVSVRALLDVEGLKNAAREADDLQKWFGERAYVVRGDTQEWDAELVRWLTRERGVALLSSHVHPAQGRAWNAAIVTPSGAELAFLGVLTEPMKADLLVLAGCNSLAQSDWLADGESSVTSLYRRTGVEAVIASLWPVNDHATSLYTGALMKALAAGKSRAAAHGDAQRAVMGARLSVGEAYSAGDRLIYQPGGAQRVAPTLTFAHPRFWAGFTLSGAWR